MSLILAASCILLLLAAGHTASAASQGPIEIEVALHASAESIDTFLQSAREYERLRPGVRVNLYGDPRITDKIQVRILEGNVPEIINSVQNVWGLIDAGYMMPLDEVLDGPNWEGDRRWRDSFLPGSLDRYAHGGKTYGVPLAYYTHAIWYDKDLFARHGWKPPATWEEFFELCEKIKRTGIAPMAFQGRYPLYAQRMIDSAYLHLAGRDRFNAQKALVPGQFDNPEMVEALRLVQRLSTNYFQPGYMGMSHTEAELQLFLGRAAMVSCGTWLLPQLEGKIPEDFRVGLFNYPLPRGKGDPHLLYASGGYFWVPKASRHPREAADFLRFLTSRNVSAQFSKRGLPVATRGVNAEHLPAKMGDLAAMLEASTGSYGDAAGERFPDMTQRWIDLYPPLLSGEITPEAAARRLEHDAAVIRARVEHPDRVTVRHRVKPAVLIALLSVAGAVWGIGFLRRSSRRRESRPIPITAGRTRMSGRNLCVFLAPAILCYTVFVIVPSGQSLSWSFYEWDGLTTRAWCGLLNFKRLLLESDAFWTALGNNLFIMLVVPLFVLPLSLFLAVCLSRRLPGWRFFRVAFFFPNVLGTVAVALLWLHVYNPQGGLMNGALVGVGDALCSLRLDAPGQWFRGFAAFPWLAPENLYWSLVPMLVWGGCGFNVILFLAAMENIPSDLYEAADLDGASPWRQFWTITLPLIWEVLSIAVVFMVIGGMKTFESIWLLTNQMPTTSTHVIGTRMVQAAFGESRIGEATAIAVLLFLMVFLGTGVTLRLMRRDTVEL